MLKFKKKIKITRQSRDPLIVCCLLKISQVSLYTCDQGAVLMKVAEELLDNYQAILSDVFDSQTEHISDSLAKEQIALNSKYTYLKHRTLNRATVALKFLIEVMPMFNWFKYGEDPDTYLKRMIVLQQSVVDAADGGDFQQDEAVVSSDCDDGKNDAEYDDEDGIRHSAVKKLLYVLNSVRAEATRADVENNRLLKESAELTANLDKSRKHLSMYRCQSSDNVNRFKVKLILLQKRSADLTDTINRLTKCVQLAMQNRHSLQSIVC